MKKRWVALALAIVVLAVAFSGIYRVSEGEEALLLTFGRLAGTRGPGMYWHVPMIQHIEKQSVTQIYTEAFGFRTTEPGWNYAPTYQDDPAEATMLTGDGNIVQVEAVYQYVVSDVQSFLFEIENPEKTMRLAFETVMRRNIQNKSLDDALLSKQTIEREVLTDLQKLLNGYNMGVSLREVRIQNITVPVEVQSAYEDVNNAKNENTRMLDEAEQYKNKILPEARGTAYRNIEEAETYKAQTIAKAEGDVANFAAVAKEYMVSPQITRRRMIIETLEKVLSNAKAKYIVDSSDSSLLKFLPIGPQESVSPTIDAGAYWPDAQ